jgi:hypothetical protein
VVAEEPPHGEPLLLRRAAPRRPPRLTGDRQLGVRESSSYRVR